MKLFAIIPMIVFLFGPCSKSNDQPVIKGKVVHRSCATVVVQVLDQSFHYLGQDSWQQSASKPVLTHVFAVKNKCTFPALSEGSVFNFKIVREDGQGNNCPVCQLWDNPPAKSQWIQVVD